MAKGWSGYGKEWDTKKTCPWSDRTHAYILRKTWPLQVYDRAKFFCLFFKDHTTFCKGVCVKVMQEAITQHVGKQYPQYCYCVAQTQPVSQFN